MSLNTEDRARLRQALEKATAGPWTLDIETEQAGSDLPEDCLSIVIPEIGRAFHDQDWAEPEDWPRDLANAELIALMRNTLPALLDRLDALEAVERELRSEWWLGHGCGIGALYGDDGEMQCNAATCRKDFKRAPLTVLREHVHTRRLALAAEALAQPQREAEGTPTRAARCGGCCFWAGGLTGPCSHPNRPAQHMPTNADYGCTLFAAAPPVREARPQGEQ